MFLEMHMLQNFAPSCLNRDDTNTPKDCEFGGYRRARISSQCQKRAVREYFREKKIFSPTEAAVRTKLLKDQLEKKLIDMGADKEMAPQVVSATIEGLGLGLDDTKTQYLLFLSGLEIDNLAETIMAHWEDLAEATALKQGVDGAEKDKKKSKKDAKKDAKKVVEKVSPVLLESLQGGRAPEIALFGRMLADLPRANVDGSCPVSYTHLTLPTN